MTRSFATLAISLAASAVSGAAFAQTIGVAATVRNEVVQVNGASTAPIDAGEEVVRNEVVRTGRDSATKLVFRDDTNLAVGPTATVTLDRFVFSGDGGAGKVSVNLVRGAFRFTTGGPTRKPMRSRRRWRRSACAARSSTCSANAARRSCVLLDGALTGCTEGGQCRADLEPGRHGDHHRHSASRVTTTPGGPGGFTFAAFCGIDGLCAPTRICSRAGGLRQFAARSADAEPRDRGTSPQFTVGMRERLPRTASTLLWCAGPLPAATARRRAACAPSIRSRPR